MALSYHKPEPKSSKFFCEHGKRILAKKMSRSIHPNEAAQFTCAYYLCVSSMKVTPVLDLR